MKLSLNWLGGYLLKKPDWSTILDKLTMAGIELEELKPVAPKFNNIVVAEVIYCEKHQSADKLTICKVNVGDLDNPLQIVCGAANVKAGIKVPCALVGSILPNGITIATREMRGVSSTGMLCSGSEIGCDDGVDGLLILDDTAVIGQSIRETLNLDDEIAEFKITPNRGDCLSVNGLLREIKALTNCELKESVPIALKSSTDHQLDINISAPDACPNYVSLIIEGVDNQISLPKWLTGRLNQSGIRSISPIVDIANYVMLEYGQPLHAFDTNKIGAKVNVRFAMDDEAIKVLDGKLVNLKSNTLVICDEKNQPAAIAGVMGGFDSGVSDLTSNIVLESAFFTPKVIAGIAKQYGLNSDAAYRFERGVDPNLQVKALNYAASLIIEFCGGKIGKLNQVTSLETRSKTITLSYIQIDNLIGLNIDKSIIKTILINLGFTILANDDEQLTVKAPSFRFDIEIYQDIIEEIARVYGYDNIKPVLPNSLSVIKPIAKDYAKNNLYKARLINLGYNEIIGYAFLEEKFEQQLGIKALKPVMLQNPIAGLSVMRTSLIADLIKSLLYNINRGCKSLRIFELARVFHGETEDKQKIRIAGLSYGQAYLPNWANEKREIDFFDIKQDVMILLAGNDEITFKAHASENGVFHHGRCAKIYQNGVEIGILGQLHPKLTQEYELAFGPYLFEIDVDSLNKQIEQFQFIPVSKFPRVERDLSFVVHDNLVVGDVLNLIHQMKLPWLSVCRVIDIFQGGNLEAGFKSVSLNFIFSGDKTLTDDEINQNIESIINLVNTKFDARLR